MRSRRRREDPFEGKAACVALFHSASFAIRAEKLARGDGLTVRLVPIPRHLSSDCGVCLLHLACDKEALIEVLNGNRVEYEGVEDL